MSHQLRCFTLLSFMKDPLHCHLIEISTTFQSSPSLSPSLPYFIILLILKKKILEHFHDEKYLRTQIGFTSSQCPVPLQCLIDGPCNLYPFHGEEKYFERKNGRKKEIEKSMFEAVCESIYCCSSFYI